MIRLVYNNLPLLGRRCIEILVLQEITHQRVKQQCLPFRLPSYSALRKKKLNSTVINKILKGWFEESVQSIRVDIKFYQN